LLVASLIAIGPALPMASCVVASVAPSITVSVESPLLFT
jgi:hypothetical protein